MNVISWFPIETELDYSDHIKISKHSYFKCSVLISEAVKIRLQFLS